MSGLASIYEFPCVSVSWDVAAASVETKKMIKDAIRNWLRSVSDQRSSQLIAGSKIYLSTDPGVVRVENQDRVAALEVSPAHGGLPFFCVAVSDGMGGMQDGAECATATLASLFYSIVRYSGRPVPEILKQATVDANIDVYERWRGKGGATLSAAVVEADGSLHISNVGDSRIYALGEGWSSLKRVTVDDNLQEAFGGQGRELVQFIGLGKALVPNIVTLSGGLDGLILTSDGAHYFEQRLFEELALKAGDPRRAGERIIAVSRWLGGPDNASVAALRVSDVANALKSKAGLPTIWSGNSQLQLVASNSTLSPENAYQASDPFQQISPHRRTSPKRKPKGDNQAKKEKQQLEIDITTDDGEDAAR